MLPVFNDLWGLFMSSNFLPSDLFNFTEFVIQETIKAPIIDAIIPEDAIIMGFSHER